VGRGRRAWPPGTNGAAERVHAVDHQDVFVLRLHHQHELALHVAEYLTSTRAPVVPLRTTLAERRARRAG
jgi:hypothetical protein